MLADSGVGGKAGWRGVRGDRLKEMEGGDVNGI